MAATYRRWMDRLYWACTGVAIACLIVISLVIPWGVFTRYVLNYGSSWPEPMATLLMALFTFVGAAAGYRVKAHLAVSLLTDRFPAAIRRIIALAVEGAMAALAVFVIVWGVRLVETTWGQAIAEFPWLSAGLTYLPVPAGGVITLFFILERVWLGAPPEPAETISDA